MEDIVKVLLGGFGGAVATGLLKILGEFLSYRRDRAVLIGGFAAEIEAGLNNLRCRTDEEHLFVASEGLPYEFYKENKQRVGVIGAFKARSVIAYHSLLWQSYKSACVLSKMHNNDKGANDAKARLDRLLKAAEKAAQLSLKALSG